MSSDNTAVQLFRFRMMQFQEQKSQTSLYVTKSKTNGTVC